MAAVYFLRYMFRHYFREPKPPTTLAKGEAIDLSIQFTLFWMPFLILLGWWTNKPFTLLFGRSQALCPLCQLTMTFADIFEVSVLIGACFLVNYVTADSKTNWAEGVTLVVFYFMIVRFASDWLLGAKLTSTRFRRFVRGSIQGNPRSASWSIARPLQRVWRRVRRMVAMVEGINDRPFAFIRQLVLLWP